MNSYRIDVNVDARLIRKWLLQNNCPKAAKTVTDNGRDGNANFVVEGNVSAVSIINVFDQLGYSYSTMPLGNSAPLPTIYVVG